SGGETCEDGESCTRMGPNGIGLCPPSGGVNSCDSNGDCGGGATCREEWEGCYNLGWHLPDFACEALSTSRDCRAHCTLNGDVPCESGPRCWPDADSSDNGFCAPGLCGDDADCPETQVCFDELNGEGTGL